MDSCEAFNKLLQQLALPEGVQVQLKLREFTTPAALYWSLTADAESTFEAILSDAAVESAMAPSVSSTPTAGKLRRLLKECEKICIEGDSPTPPNTLAELALPVAASPNNQLLGLTWGLSFPQSPWPSFGMILPKTIPQRRCVEMFALAGRWCRPSGCKNHTMS